LEEQGLKGERLEVEAAGGITVPVGAEGIERGKAGRAAAATGEDGGNPEAAGSSGEDGFAAYGAPCEQADEMGDGGAFGTGGGEGENTLGLRAKGEAGRAGQPEFARSLAVKGEVPHGGEW